MARGVRTNSQFKYQGKRNAEFGRVYKSISVKCTMVRRGGFSQRVGGRPGDSEKTWVGVYCYNQNRTSKKKLGGGTKKKGNCRVTGRKLKLSILRERVTRWDGRKTKKRMTEKGREKKEKTGGKSTPSCLAKITRKATGQEKKEGGKGEKKTRIIHQVAGKTSHVC